MSASSTSPKLERTKTPCIYKRGSRYVVIYRDLQGRQRKRAARTFGEARELKATLTADVARGEYRALSRVTFLEYAPEWISSYTGRTSHGVRQETLDDYRRDLGLDAEGELIGDGAIAFFGRMRLAEVEPRHVKQYAATLAARGLAPGSVRNGLAPIRALFRDSVRGGHHPHESGGRIDAPKSRYGRRAVPLSAGLSQALWVRRGSQPEEALVFASQTGGYLDASNVASRVLKPAAKAAGVGWVGFHTFRHSAATTLFKNGLNAKQVQVWLGHHSPAFTLATYVHLLADDLPDPDFLDALTAGNETATRPTETGREAATVDGLETRTLPGLARQPETAAGFS